MNNQPLVTINILSFNRIEELRLTLSKVYEQDYKNLEVIVVDNASSDGSAEMVKKEFPFVFLISLNKNTGIAGWNDGFAFAKGEFILVLDDDSYPLNGCISAGVEIMKRNSNAGIVAYQVFNKADDKYALTFTTPQLTFIGCGALIRKECLALTGGFDKNLFIYEHEVEFSMRLLSKNYKIYTCSDFYVIHNTSPKNRQIQKFNFKLNRRIFYVTRNIIYILFIHFSFKKAYFRIFRIASGRVLRCKNINDFISSFLGVISSVYLSLSSFKSRNILPKDIQELYSYGKFAGGFYFNDNAWK